MYGRRLIRDRAPIMVTHFMVTHCPKAAHRPDLDRTSVVEPLMSAARMEQKAVW